MSAERVVYSIQQTYILTEKSKPEGKIVTCNQIIDIPTIEPLPQMKIIGNKDNQPTIIIPCIEIVGNFLTEFDLTFETNEGVTVLPVKIVPANQDPMGNPYMGFRYVLVLPRGATGVKSCKLIHKDTGEEVQHNLTFGVMPPPYNYDNVLFSYLNYGLATVINFLGVLQSTVYGLKLTTETPTFEFKNLPKGEGKQTISIELGVLFYETEFRYPSSTETTVHKPKITLRGDNRDFVYTLSLDRTQANVLIDLFARTITVYDKNTGEIIKQLMLPLTSLGYKTLSFENFDDIDSSGLLIVPRGARVK